jgi:hypothetical protein
MKKKMSFPTLPLSQLPEELQYNNYKISSDLVVKSRRKTISQRMMSYEYIDVYYFAGYHFTSN